MGFFKQTNRRTVSAVAVSAAILVPLGVLGAPALAGSNGPSAAQYQYKITLCHKTQWKKAVTKKWVKITVGAPAVKAHLKHGDFVVDPAHPCPPVTAAAATTSGTSKSGRHDNGKHQGTASDPSAGSGHGNGKAKGHGK
jgi:hypothetical protein